MAKFDCCRHNFMALFGNPVIVGFGYPIDQIMRSQQPQVSGDPRRVLATLVWVVVGLWIQVLAQVVVADSLDQEFTSQDLTEDATIFRANGSQRPKLSTLALDPFTYLIQQLVRRSGFTYHGERLQIALISRARNRHAPADIGNAFTQGQPFHDYYPGFICLPSAHLKTPRIIDRRFHSQHAASFVVHLDRVLFDPMPDAQTFDSSLQTSSYFAIVAAISSAAQKPQYIFTMKLLHGVVDQGGIGGRQGPRVSEQNVSGVFSFADGPVVRSQAEFAFRIEPGVNFAGQRLQKLAPVPRGQLITELLRSAQVSDPGKAVTLLLEADAGLLHLPGQILAAIETDLNTQWQPGLQTHVHQAKFAVGEIEVEMQTLALTFDQLQPLTRRIPTNPERATGLETRQHTNQALANLILFHNFPGSLFLRDARRRQVDKGAVRLRRQLFGMVLHPLRDLLHERFEVLVKNSLARHKSVHAPKVTYRTQVTSEQNAIKTCYSAEDAAFVPFQKALHDAPPVEFSQTHYPVLASWGVNIFGCG